jgi:hypothetical protein
MKINKVIAGLLIGATFLTSCKKEDDSSSSSSSGCSINTSELTSGVWLPPAEYSDFFATLTFSSDGKYYENGEYEGDWTNINNCDSIYVKRPVGSFYCVIVSISSSELNIRNPVFGEILYTK